MTNGFETPRDHREREAAIDSILSAVKQEMLRAVTLHGPMTSGHEAHGVIAEELEELWEDVRRDDIRAAHKEAVQVAAMACRFLLDVPADSRKAKPAPFTAAEIEALRAIVQSRVHGG